MNTSTSILRIAAQLPIRASPASRPLLQNARIRNFSTFKRTLNSTKSRTKQTRNINRRNVHSHHTGNNDSSFGLFGVIMGGLAITVVLETSIKWAVDLRRMAPKADAGKNIPDEFEGKAVIVAPGGQKVLAHDEKTGEDIELVPTGTSTIPHFPRTIQLPAAGVVNEQETEYTLVGLGIRTVSFLSIQVYVVGLYVQTSSLAALQTKFIKRVNPIASTLIAGEKDTLKNSLLDPEESYKLWDELLRDTSGQFASAFRIVPTRGTDFNHLRDGWVRGITTRTQAAQQKGDNEFADEQFGMSMREFNTLFKQKGKAPRGSEVILLRDGKGRLELLYTNKEKKLERFGTLDDERISRLIWLGYLGGKGVSSEDARKNIVDGVIELVERPVGTAALKVS